MKLHRDELTEVDNRRRGFFKAVSRGVTQSIEETGSSKVNAGRPLGAVESSLFERMCNHCSECVTICPQGIIAMTANGPQMDLSLNHCTFCQACIEACPTQALNLLNNKDTGWRPKFSHSCNARLFDNCQECKDDCPNNAIIIETNHLPTLSKSCNGCGECVASCYIGAISLITNTN